MSASRKRQALRTRLAGPELAALISFVNCVPPSRELPDVLEKLAIANVPAAQYGKKFRSALEGALPRKECAAFWEWFGPFFPDRWPGATRLYSELVTARTLLRAIATSPPGPGRFELPPLGSSALVDAEVCQDGRMRLVFGTLLKVLQEVEASRIRLCPICDAIYWAGRTDQPACAKCVNNARQRRWKKRYTEKYKQQRYDKAERAAKAG